MKEKFKRVILNRKKSNYKVSNLGRVKNTETGRFLKPRIHTGGYLQVSLYDDTDEYRFYIHRLVMLTFSPINDDSLQVNHIDGDKTNNSIGNLEWCDNSYNQKHAYANGLKPSLVGEKHHVAKFTDAEVIDICRMMSSGADNFTIRRKYPKANGDFLLSIRKGRNWTHISKEYVFPDVDNSVSGERNGSVKYTDAQVHSICKMILRGYSTKDISNELDIPMDYVSKIKRRAVRKNISEGYGIKYEEGSTTIEMEFIFTE